jgi:hypothetical protein
MRLLAATLLISALSSIAASEDQPWAIDKPLESPLHSFSVVQHRDGNWSTTVHFERIHAPDITFTEVYPWPALFYVSPDDRWMLQIQKSGSGDNISFLFHIDSEGRFWRMEPGLMELAWAFIEHTQSLHQSDLYHTGIDFRRWDLRAHLLHFTFHGTYDTRHEALEVPLTYDLQKHVVARDTKA